MANFEDSGIYYANQEMVVKSLALSMDSGLVYDIEDADDVHIIRLVSDRFFAIAKEDIANDGPCFYGRASIFTTINEKLCWEL